MLLRVIKEQFHADGAPVLDMSKPHQPQLVNGGTVRIINPKTGAAETYLPGETFELPEPMAQEMLLNSPQTIEPEERHQARLARRKRMDADREAERGALDARIQELDRTVQQAQKLRAMSEQRERELAAENLRVQQQSAGQGAQIEQLRREIEEMQRRHAAELADISSRVAAPAVAAPAPGQPASDVPPDTSTAAPVAPPAAVSEPTAQPERRRGK
jgi:hypothetical protein